MALFVKSTGFSFYVHLSGCLCIIFVGINICSVSISLGPCSGTVKLHFRISNFKLLTMFLTFHSSHLFILTHIWHCLIFAVVFSDETAVYFVGYNIISDVNFLRTLWPRGKNFVLRLGLHGLSLKDLSSLCPGVCKLALVKIRILKQLIDNNSQVWSVYLLFLFHFVFIQWCMHILTI